MSIRTAATSGDRRTALEALRDHLAAALEVADERSVAPIANQLRQVLADLDEIPAAEEASTVDDLAARRATRRSAASGL